MFNELKFLKKLYAKKRKAGANIKPFFQPPKAFWFIFKKNILVFLMNFTLIGCALKR